jgi:hypothetical protein
MSLAQASSTFGITLVAAGGIGTWLGGAWADRWIARARATNDDDAAARIALRVGAITGAVAAPFSAACFFAPTPAVFFAFAFVTELAVFASTSPINAGVFRAVPVPLRASAMAIMIFAIHMFGDLWSPPLLGYALDVLRPAIAMMGVPIVIAAGALAWLTTISRTRSAEGTASPLRTPP